MKHLQFLCGALSATLVLLGQGQTWAQSKTGGGSAAAAPAVADRGASHALTQQLAKMGVLACAERGNQVASFLDPARRAEVLVPSTPAQPNQRLLLANLVVPVEQGGSALAGIALAPNQANGCGGGYQVTSWVDLPCDKATARHFPNLVFKELVPKGVRAAALGPLSWAVAMPAGPGCLLQKAELVQ